MGASQWLADVDDLARDVEAEWRLRLGRVCPDSTEALVIDVELEDGTPGVLKLMIPRDDLQSPRHEITALELAAGRGCVRVLRSDLERAAVVLERLGPSLHELGLPLRRRLEILCDTVRAMWRPAPGHGLPTGAQKAAWLSSFIEEKWERLDRPCSARAVAHALGCSERRRLAHDDERAVLVHGDAHAWNALRITGEPEEHPTGFKLIDPDGLLAEAEYDLGVLMRGDPRELLEGDPFERARWLAARSGLDATAVWEWGVVERVSSGLLATEIGVQPVGQWMLTAADRIAELLR